MKGPWCGAAPARDRNSSTTPATTRIGTGANHSMPGQVNQRAATSASASGVQMLTATIAATSSSASGRAVVSMRRCSGPSVRKISQVQPSRV